MLLQRKIPVKGLCRLFFLRDSFLYCELYSNRIILQQYEFNNIYMPTVLRVGGFRFYFYSHETNEPPHIHVDKESNSAKFWLEPVSLARNIGYAAKDLRKIQELVVINKSLFLERWNEYFNQSL